MDEANLERIIEDLQSEAERLTERRQELQQGLDAIDAELQRVQAGITALRGKAATRGKSSKQSPNKEAVRTAARRCLSDGGILSQDELKTAVGEEIKAAGFSRVGMALRLNEVLEEKEFVSSVEGVRLAAEQPSSDAIALGSG